MKFPQVGFVIINDLCWFSEVKPLIVIRLVLVGCAVDMAVTCRLARVRFNWQPKSYLCAYPNPPKVL